MTNFWKDFFKNNSLFFYSFIVFLLGCLLLLLNIDKGDAIFFFSENRTTIGDTFFYYATKVGEEPTYLILTILFLFIRFRYALLIPLIGLIVMAVSFNMKEFFAHPRPSKFFKGEGIFDTLNLVEGVTLYVGNTSFPSGHTMSGFAIFSLCAFMIKDKKLLGFFFLLLAAMVGISRIYLVQHFLEDIFLGSMMGVLLSMILYRVQSYISYDSNKWWNRSLLNLKGKPVQKV